MAESKHKEMTNEKTIDNLLQEAERYRFQPDLLELVEKLTKMNPKMDRDDAVKIAFHHFKTQSELGTRN